MQFSAVLVRPYFSPPAALGHAVPAPAVRFAAVAELAVNGSPTAVHSAAAVLVACVNGRRAPGDVNRLGPPYRRRPSRARTQCGRVVRFQHSAGLYLVDLRPQVFDGLGQDVDLVAQGPVCVLGRGRRVFPCLDPYPLDLIEHAVLNVHPKHLQAGPQSYRQGEQHDRQDCQDDSDAQRSGALAEQENEDGHRGEGHAAPEQSLRHLPTPNVLRVVGRHAARLAGICEE